MWTEFFSILTSNNAEWEPTVVDRTYLPHIKSLQGPTGMCCISRLYDFTDFFSGKWENRAQGLCKAAVMNF